MADSLRDKLAKNTAASPATRAAATFVGTAAAPPPAGDTRKNQRTTVYLSPELRRRLKIAAANADRTMNDLITDALTGWLDAHGH